MVQIKTNLSKMLWHLKNRSNMYILDNTYDAMITFFLGYLVAIQDFTNISIDAMFQKYLQQKFNKQFSVHWSGYLLRWYCQEDEEKAMQCFFEFWEIFIETSDFQ